MSKFILIMKHQEIFFTPQGERDNIRMEIEVRNQYGRPVNTIKINKEKDGTLAFCGYKNYVLVDELIEILQQIKEKFGEKEEE